MGFRFSKSVKLFGGTRLNFSKRGVGISTGVKGFRVGVGPSGVRKTLSLPGTGLSYTSTTSFGRSQAGRAAAMPASPALDVPLFLQPLDARHFYGKRWLAGSLILIMVGAGMPPVLLLAVPMLFWFIYVWWRSPRNRPRWAHNRALRYFKAAKHLKCRQTLEAALASPYAHPRGRALLAAACYALSDYDCALAALTALDPGDREVPEIKHMEAWSRHQTGDFAGAIPLWQQLSRQAPDDLFYLNALGVAFMQTGDYTTAIETFKQAPLQKRTANPELTEIRYYLGACYVQVGDKRKARTQLQKVYSEDVSYRNVAELLAEC